MSWEAFLSLQLFWKHLCVTSIISSLNIYNSPVKPFSFARATFAFNMNFRINMSISISTIIFSIYLHRNFWWRNTREAKCRYLSFAFFPAFCPQSCKGIDRQRNGQHLEAFIDEEGTRNIFTMVNQEWAVCVF